MNIPAENQRVKKVINYYCNSNELLFSKEIGISQPRINRLFSIDTRNGKYPLVSFEIAQAIINKFINVNANWLLTGKGQMLREDNNSDYFQKENTIQVNETIPVYNKANKSCEDVLNENHQLIKENKALMQQNSALKDDKIALIEEKFSLKDENTTLKYKVKELETEKNYLSKEITILKKAQQSSPVIQDDKHKLT